MNTTTQRTIPFASLALNAGQRAIELATASPGRSDGHSQTISRSQIMNHEINTQIEIQDLNDVAVELNDEELQAVAGARMTVSWKCGSSKLADEWIVS